MPTKLPTFAVARTRLQEALRAAGWALSPSLNPQGRPYKVPYADSPSRRVRVWFKPQALYYTVGLSLTDAVRFADKFEAIALS